MKTILPESVCWVLKKNIYCLCFLAILLAQQATAQTVTTGKSYINITRPNGGTFLPGDIIEVRATIAVNGGSNSSGSRVNAVRYNDTINTAYFEYIPNSLQYTSNEGRPMVPGLNIPAFTDGADNDSAHIDIASGRLRFNIGSNAGSCNVLTQGTSTTNAGRLWGRLFPTFGNNNIRMYVYRVRINPATVSIDMTILLSAGNFRYRIGNSNSDVSSNFSPYRIKIAPDYGLCSNSIGANAIVGESGGTFGSGSAQNKSGGTSFVPPPYTFVNFSTNGPNDNYYGVANRTSANGSTNPNVAYWASGNRVFTVWDIIGDHTGAADPYAGNPPTSQGYALIINASYQTNRAFTQNISNLCENTYYEFSAWFRNICRYCSSDSSGKGANTTNFVPGPGKDSAGVRPNLSFQIDGVEYYTSGNIPYTGLWVKKGFVFKTGDGQTSMTVTIRNNAPGGGGNDWAIDDIGVATCLPNMKYSPSLTPNVCANNALTIYDTVRSYFDNYVYYKWQRSTNGGEDWTDVSAMIGPVEATKEGGVWQYVSSYTVHPSETGPANSGDQYRLIVASSTDNLSNDNCRSTDVTNAVTMNVLECGPILQVKMLSFNGRVDNNKAIIKWTTSGEDEPLYYDIEKSYDGNRFTVVGTIDGYNLAGPNYYSFTDPNNLTGKAFYRIKTRTVDRHNSYSRILSLSALTEPFAFATVVNPFSNTLYFDIATEKAGVVKTELLDQFGNPVRRKSFDAREGNNQFLLDNTGDLPAGIYVLKAECRGKMIYRKVLKN